MKRVLHYFTALVAVLWCQLVEAGVAHTADVETTASMVEMSKAPYLQPSYVRITLRYPGVYKVTGADLEQAGVSLEEVRPEALTLWNAGTALPLHLSPTSREAFNRDDFIAFVGSPPRGTYSYYMPNNLYNVYYLTLNSGPALRFKPATGPQDPITSAAFMCKEHREIDGRFRHSKLEPGTTDNFFWSLFQAGEDPKGQRLFTSFPGFDAQPGFPVMLTTRMFGLTEVAPLEPDHKFTVRYGKHDLGTFSFNGVQYSDWHTSIPASAVSERERLTFHTPPDRADAVDQVALDSMTVQYPRRLDAEYRDYFVFNNDLLTTGIADQRGAVVTGLVPGSLIYDQGNSLVYTSEGSTTSAVSLGDTPTTFVAVSPDGYMEADKISSKRQPRELSQIDPATEVLVLFHPNIAQGVEAYARYRKSRGKKLKLANVNDIYDALNNGFISDIALKRYIRYVASEAPKLSHIVLFGDATYDYREAREHNSEFPPHILIPIHWVYNPATTWAGGYQDDNWYGSLQEPFRPDLAVGRIPANNNYEAIEYVKKIIEHEVLPPPAKTKALLISSVEQSFQDLVTEVKTLYQDRFSTFSLLFPETSRATTEIENLQNEINGGVDLLYYVGHGGSMVWRVGPVDYQQQKDLFTPAEVRKLRNHGRYPVVACSSCYTTSFDQTDSLGEALILQPAGGAIAILGSPWKATVYESHDFNRALFKHYFSKDVETIGEAALRAHRDVTPAGTTRASFQSFTMLGDPCVELRK